MTSQSSGDGLEVWMRMNSRRRIAARILGCFVVASCLPGVAAAQEGFPALCALLTHQARVELEDLGLAARMADTRLEVDEKMFQLLDDLRQNELVKRLVYKAGKHRRDAAVINLELARRRVERQGAIVEQHLLACEPADQGRATAGGDSLGRPRDRYRVADCAIRGLEVDLFEVDVAYEQEVLTSARNLRQSDIASVQEVLAAERAVELTRQQLELAHQRAERCQQ